LEALPGTHIEKTFEDLKTAQFRAATSVVSASSALANNTMNVEFLNTEDQHKEPWKASSNQLFSRVDV